MERPVRGRSACACGAGRRNPDGSGCPSRSSNGSLVTQHHHCAWWWRAGGRAVRPDVGGPVGPSRWSGISYSSAGRCPATAPWGGALAAGERRGGVRVRGWPATRAAHGLAVPHPRWTDQAPAARRPTTIGPPLTPWSGRPHSGSGTPRHSRSGTGRVRAARSTPAVTPEGCAVGGRTGCGGGCSGQTARREGGGVVGREPGPDSERPVRGGNSSSCDDE